MDLAPALLVNEVDHHRVAGPGGAPVGGSELGGDRLQQLQLRVDELGGNLGVGPRDLERAPVGERRLRLHAEGGAEAPGLRVGGR